MRRPNNKSTAFWRAEPVVHSREGLILQIIRAKPEMMPTRKEPSARQTRMALNAKPVNMPPITKMRVPRMQ